MGDPARQCHGKRTFLTRKEAKRAAKMHLSTGGGPIGIYRCPHCERLHLGHTRHGRRAKRAAS